MTNPFWQTCGWVGWIQLHRVTKWGIAEPGLLICSADRCPQSHPAYIVRNRFKSFSLTQFKTIPQKSETVAAGCIFCCRLPSKLAFHTCISCQHKCHELDSKMVFKPPWPIFWLWKWGQVDSIFKSLLKTMAKIADDITRALRLKVFDGAFVSEKCWLYLHVLHYICFVY